MVKMPTEYSWYPLSHQPLDIFLAVSTIVISAVGFDGAKPAGV